ncbi:MAG: anti-sigma factor [Burkholderiales bacterium]|nr:anti-sigma factor [Burkholderiales bacterium]
MQTPHYTDEELSAWVDGEGSAAERAEIEAWLRAHPDEAALAQAWARDREALRAAYAAVAQEPVPERLAEVVWPAARGATGSAGSAGHRHGGWRGRQMLDLFREPTWRLASAAAALFLLGAVAGGALSWQWQERTTLARARAAAGKLAAAPAPQNWLQRAAFAHSVYTPEPRHAVEVKAQEEHLARWLTRRIEAPVKLFDLRAMGFELVGGRLLPDGPGKSAQLMYQDGSGKRVTVYLRKPEPGTDTAFRYEQQGSLGLFYWVDEKTGFALVGELPKEQLLAMAKSIYDQDATLPAPSLTAPAAASGPAPAGASSPGR